MKKSIIIILFAIVSIAGKCQPTANIITPTEYNNIEINDIRLGDIKETHGVESEMENLFGIPTTKEIEPYYFNNFEYEGFKIGFSAMISDGTIDSPILSGFDITNNNFNITIQGITVTIGDNISALGNVVFNTGKSGDKSIIYQYCDGCNNYIVIRYNQTTNIITEIGFIEQT